MVVGFSLFLVFIMQGLGNKFLSHIREVDSILQVLVHDFHLEISSLFSILNSSS